MILIFFLKKNVLGEQILEVSLNFSHDRPDISSTTVIDHQQCYHQQAPLPTLKSTLICDSANCYIFT